MNLTQHGEKSVEVSFRNSGLCMQVYEMDSGLVEIKLDTGGIRHVLEVAGDKVLFDGVVIHPSNVEE